MKVVCCKKSKNMQLKKWQKKKRKVEEVDCLLWRQKMETKVYQ